ncbi:MAG: Holliday junction resolvase RuvX [Cyanobacteria bacterium]|nr:Holliday junction resolvase RuvX [Cyanobacteriota bacterium]
MGRVVTAIALDVGRRRIGVAGCDRLGLGAIPLTTITRSTFEEEVAQLRAIATERGATVLIVGVPLVGPGQSEKQMRYCKKWGQRFAEALDLPLVWVDEQLSSMEAEAALRDRGVRPSENKAAIDQVAAAVILQRWLTEGRAPLG